MSEKQADQAYTHRSTVPGTAGQDDAHTEHRETAGSDAEERNELTPDQRGGTDGYGPRTHDDTRITRKGS